MQNIQVQSKFKIFDWAYASKRQKNLCFIEYQKEQ